ncbi:MAG: DUF72 domain-containing protein [Thermoanaerobaculia bacterium]
MIRIGPAGWSYKDWEGVVYPPHGSRFDHLAYLAHFFGTIEVNSSFYRIPPVGHAKSWIRRVGGNPDFRFTVKLYRGFTHEESAAANDAKEFRDFLDPLQENGRLGALLVQFPWSFKEDGSAEERLSGILETFDDYPKAVEVRHASFQNDRFYRFLDEHKTGFVNIDQPLFSDSVRPSSVVTGGLGYARLHGRNYQKWFAHSESWERYDYLYSAGELEPWVERVESMSRDADVYVITNNHFRGQAIVNALELEKALGGTPEIPPQLISQYPERFPSVG